MGCNIPPVLVEKSERLAWCTRLLKLKVDQNHEFTACALELFHWQRQKNRVYAKLLQREHIDPASVTTWQQIPALPQSLFKESRVATHSSAETRHTFLSSGTTGGPRSQHPLRDLRIYEKLSASRVPMFSIRPSFNQPSGRKMILHFLTPTEREAPESSLSQMFSFWKRRWGSKGSRFWIRQGELNVSGLQNALKASIAEGHPVGILGPAFSFVHLLDASGKASFPLPAGSFLMETGGFKGRSREIRKPVLYRQLGQFFALPDKEIWNEYGMSELCSQAYARGTRGEHRTPPWARVLVMDPVTNREVRVGQQGLVRWIDLANTDSVLAVQTLDLARRTREGFLLLGRLPQFPRRGCSLSVEDVVRK